MKRVLVISSLVAASSVGANNSAFCLRRLGIETVVLPTVLLGRHPGWGAPGGSATPIALLSDIWNGIKAQNMNFDAILTGFIGTLENLDVTEKIIRQVKQTNPNVAIIVDPVMGDNGKLYVPVEVGDGIISRLIPHADIITPNVWEFSHLMQTDLSKLDDLGNALRDYGGCALITSVIHDDQIGGLSYHPDGLSYIGHPKFDSVPHGGGDAIAGSLLGHILSGDSEEFAAQKSISAIFEIMKLAEDNKLSEFPLTLGQDKLVEAPNLSVHRLL